MVFKVNRALDLQIEANRLGMEKAQGKAKEGTNGLW